MKAAIPKDAIAPNRDSGGSRSQPRPYNDSYDDMYAPRPYEAMREFCTVLRSTHAVPPL